MRIMLVDDHPLVLDSIANALELFDHRCDSFQSPSMALRMLRKNYYDVAIIDVSLQEMNGLDVARAINEADPEVKVIIISGQGDIASEVLALGSFVCAFFKKPIGIMAMIDLLETLAHKKNRPPSAETVECGAVNGV